MECNNCETGEQCGAIMHGNAVTFCEPYGPRELVSMCYLCTLFQIHFTEFSLQQRFSYAIPIQMKMCGITYESYCKYLKIRWSDFSLFSNVKNKEFSKKKIGSLNGSHMIIRLFKNMGVTCMT